MLMKSTVLPLGPMSVLGKTAQDQVIHSGIWSASRVPLLLLANPLCQNPDCYAASVEVGILFMWEKL